MVHDTRFDGAKEHRYVLVQDTRGTYKFDDLLGPYIENNTVDSAGVWLVHRPKGNKQAARNAYLFWCNERSPDLTGGFRN